MITSSQIVIFCLEVNSGLPLIVGLSACNVKQNGLTTSPRKRQKTMRCLPTFIGSVLLIHAERLRIFSSVII